MLSLLETMTTAVHHFRMHCLFISRTLLGTHNVCRGSHLRCDFPRKFRPTICSTTPTYGCSPRRIALWWVQLSCDYEWWKWTGTLWTLGVPKIYASPNAVVRFLFCNVERWSTEEQKKRGRKPLKCMPKHNQTRDI